MASSAPASTPMQSFLCRCVECERSKRAQIIPFHGGQLRIIGLADFVAMKAFAGSPQDIADARRAIEMNRASLDTELVVRLARGFGHAAAETVDKLIR